MTFGWCVTHRLELALKDSLKGTDFDDIDDLILKMYYLYKCSPKKLCQLKELVEIYSDSFEFLDQGVKPKKASGTRWIAHKTRALDLIIDKFGLLMQHLENLSEDKSYPAKERHTFKGWYNKWMKARIPLLICVFVEVLAPAGILSKAFQSKDINVVTTDSLLSQCKLQLQIIEQKPFEELPTVRPFLEKVKVDDDGKSKFQDVVLKDFDRGKESARNLKSTLASVISKTIQLRLEDGNDSVVSKYLVHALNTEGWFHYEKDSGFISKGIEELFEFYKLPLQTAGSLASATEFLLEFHDMVSYALKYFHL